ncbi:DUF2971 domain-containing protein [Rhizobium sp. S152]|uniref:DUF2971 domain-containing protein n=1 Tax=Rhizobium sp. S152 TaxID=3055038 RepID=UPI0025A95F07|nr:DUF2971 domain-containing protein [Rhizobium sp. S152]MDM9628488.1 DUF2971 domain-containing protein [Rhizobium sp. S152]
MAHLEYEPTEPLYHYCTPDGFRGILKSKVLWFNDLTQMNDPRELELGLEHFIEALKSVRHNEYEGYRGFFLSILAARLTSLNLSQQAFCCCFSLAGDELPLWREYTNLEGLSIGFRPTAIKDINARVQKANYLIGHSLEALRAKVLEIAEPFDPDGEPADDAFWTNASVSAYAYITAVKHGSWAYEREIRMIHVQAREMPASFPADDSQWIMPSKREGRLGEVSYLPLPFGRYREAENKHRRAIAKVIIGPKCALTRQDVEKLLSDDGYTGVEVLESECQIR